MEFILLLLVVGFSVYWLIRHPIKTLKIVAATAGLVLLGALALSAAAAVMKCI